MAGVFRAIARFSVRFRYVIVVFWVGAAVASVVFLPSLASAVQTQNTNFLPASSPSVRAGVLASPVLQIGHGQVVVVAGRSSGPLSAADEGALKTLVSRLAAVKTVLGAHLVAISPNGRAAQIVVVSTVSPAGATPASTTLVDAVRSVISHTALPPGLIAHTAGPLATAVDNQAASQSAGTRTNVLSVVFILVLLLLVFRAPLAPVLMVLPAALVVTLAGPVIGELGQHGVAVSSVTQLLLIVLVLGAGTDYGLFLVFRVREELRAGAPSHEAIVRALSRVGESITFSAATVIGALLALLLAQFGLYRGLGIPLAVGVGFMLLVGLTLLPALLAIFGRATFWPVRITPGAARAGTWGRVAASVVRRPVIVLVVGVLFFGGLSIAALGNRATGFAGGTSAPAGSDAAAGNAMLTAAFPRASANPTNLILRYPRPIWQSPAAVAGAETQLAASPLFHSLLGPFDPTGVAIAPAELLRLHTLLGPSRTLPPLPPVALRAHLAAARVTVGEYEAYRATAQYIGPGGHTVQMQASLTAGSPSSTAALQAVPAIRSTLTQVASSTGAVGSGVAGEAAGIADVNAVASQDLTRIVPIVIVVIAVLLGLVLRSLVAPLYLVVSVVLSYFASLGMAVLVFMDLKGESGLTFILPFLMFIFLLALGEDYNILVMTRIREEAHHYPLREAVTRAMAATGTTVTSAGLVLAGTFLVLAFSAGNSPSASQVQDVGFGLGLGVLMDAFLVRTLLVPSIVVLLGRWNWWPSRLEFSEPTASSHPTHSEDTTSPVR